MQRVEKHVDVDRPVDEVYGRWTQFEYFPKFMAGVKEVRQLDDTHLRWRANLWGKDKEWVSEITEQVPHARISWKSVSGSVSSGTVRFEPIEAGRTRVSLQIAYQPEGLLESAANTLGFLDAQVQNAVDDFKLYLETHRH